MRHDKRGFSLIELSMVIAISGLMLGFVLQSKQSAGISTCYPATKNQLATIRTAIESFARKNDRLPMPASRTAGVEDITYGREALAAGVTTAGTSYWGAVPFQALALPASFGADCWGNKLTYVVTSALTTNATSGGFMDTTVNGTITLKSTTATTINTATAYAVISHGEDGLGAVKANATTASWCSGATLKSLNCLATAATVADAAFNNGSGAGGNYYDDVIVTRGKPQTVANTNLYCWGGDSYGYGILGDGSYAVHNITTPTRVKSGVTFAKFREVGGYLAPGTMCALTADGTAYCWGDNPNGQVGDGTSGNKRPVPTAVSTSVKFSKIYTFVYGNAESYTAALAPDGTPYMWGPLGWRTATGANYLSPLAVSTSVKFTKLVSPYGSLCGLTAAGDVYCWGSDTYAQGQYIPNFSPGSFGTVQIVQGGHKFADIYSQVSSICGITNASDPSGAGKLFCWGVFGPIGNGIPALTITGISKANPGIITYTGSYSLRSGDTFIIRNVQGMTGVNYSTYVVPYTGYTATTTPMAQAYYLSGIDTSSYGTYTSGGQIIVTSSPVPREVTVSGITFTSFADGYTGTDTSPRVTGSDGKLYLWGLMDHGETGWGATPGGRVLSGASISSISLTNPAVATTTTAHGLTAGDYIFYFSGDAPTPAMAYYGAYYIVGTVTSSTTFQIKNMNGVNINASTSTGTGAGQENKVPTDGSFFTWRIGDTWHDTGSFSMLPVSGITNITNAINMSGLANSFGVSSGVPYGWGAGSGWGCPLGNNTTGSSYTPTPLTMTGITFSGYIYGDACTNYLTDTSNNLYCWGKNSVYNCGLGTTTDVLKPTLIPGGKTWSAISAVGAGYGGSAFCGIATN